MPVSSRLRLFGAKVEATLGTAESLTNAASVTNVVDMDHTDSTEIVEIPAQNSFGMKTAHPGARSGSMSFQFYMVGNGATGLPYWANWLTGCGGAFTSQVFAPVRDNAVGLTAGIYRGISTTAVYQPLYGAMGNAVMTFQAGRISPIRFNLTGCVGPETTVTLPTVTQVTIAPPRCTGAAVTIGGTEVIADMVEFDMGNTVIMRQAVGASGGTSGYASAWIPNRKPIIRISPEASGLSAKDWSDVFYSRTTAALVVTLGSDANNTITLAAPAIQLTRPPGNGDRNGLWTRSLEFTCNQNADTEDSDYTITFA